MGYKDQTIINDVAAADAEKPKQEANAEQVKEPVINNNDLENSTPVDIEFDNNDHENGISSPHLTKAKQNEQF